MTHHDDFFNGPMPKTWEDHLIVGGCFLVLMGIAGILIGLIGLISLI